MPPPDRRFFTSYSLRISFVHPRLKNRKHRRNRRTTTDKQDSYRDSQTEQEKGLFA